MWYSGRRWPWSQATWEYFRELKNWGNDTCGAVSEHDKPLLVNGCYLPADPPSKVHWGQQSSQQDSLHTSARFPWGRTGMFSKTNCFLPELIHAGNSTNFSFKTTCTSEEYWEDGSARCPRLPKCLLCEDHCYYSIMLLSHWFTEFTKHNQKEEVEDDDVF